MMGFKAANEFAFVNARIRGIMSHFLTVADYESLMQSKSYEEFIRTLSNTYYGPVISRHSGTATPNPSELGIILSKDFAEVSHNLSRSLTGSVSDFTQAYMTTFLAESIKSMVRGLYVGLDKDEILRFAVPTSPEEADLFSKLVETGSVDRFIEELPFWDAQVALLTRMPLYEEFRSTAPLEVAIEEWYLRKLMSALNEFSARNILTMLRALALGLDSRIIDASMVRFTRKSRTIMDAIKVKPSWREVFSYLEGTRYAQLAGRLARSYEDTQDLVALELAIEDYIAQRVKHQLTAYPFHLGTVIGFFNLKFFEVRNIRSLAVGIERGESADIMRRMITIW
ncbi:MAG: V-type ATPase subunit [Candidatus Thorarchaeota archaeon]|jgi:vacuolar-type H+-ATPase subunit C/Vma6